MSEHESEALADMSPEDEEESTSTARLITNLSSSYLYVRLQAVERVKDLFLNVNSGEGEVKAGPFKRLGRCIMSALIDKQYHEKAYRSALASTLITALSVTLPFDFKSFASEYMTENKSKYLLAQTKASAIELCLIVLSFSAEVDGVECSKAVTAEGTKGGDGVMGADNLLSSQSLSPAHCSCIQTIGELLDSIDIDNSGRTGRLQQICCGQIGLVLRKSIVMLEHAVTCWTEYGFISSLTQLYYYFTTLPTIAIVEGKRQKPATPSFNLVIKRLTKSIIDLINKKFLASKVPVSAASLEKLGGYLSRLSAADWSDSGGEGGQTQGTEAEKSGVAAEGGGLEAAALRTMKKSPEGSASIISAILSCITVDLSTFIKNGAAVAALRIVKSPNAEVRESGMRIVRNLAVKCSDSSAFESMVRVYLEALQGKGPTALVQPYQRYSVFVGLSDCADGSKVQALGSGKC